MKQIFSLFGVVFLCMGGALMFIGNMATIIGLDEQAKIKNDRIIAGSTNSYCCGIGLILISGLLP